MIEERQSETYAAVRSVAIAVLGGAVVQASGVSAGNGIVIDWRTVKSGEELQRDADAFDTAQLFVALVGAYGALAALGEHAAASAPEPVAIPPRVTAFMPDNNGGRRRQFDAGPFTVKVEPYEDDAAQAAFVERLVEAVAAMRLSA
jgi:hypothetical protein